MNGEKKKKLKDESPKMKQNKTSLPTKYKFNISYDSLCCFINPSKFTRVSRKKQTSNIKPKSPKQNIHFNLSKPDTSHEPDLTKQVSNYILKRIETQGIMCKWEQDYTIEQNKQQEEQDRRLWRTFSDSYSIKSFASTNDNYLHPFSYGNCYLTNEQPIKSYDSQVYQIDLDNVGNDPRTTIMIKNIPNKYSIQDLSAEIDDILPNTYDFLYLPCDLKNQCNVGYGFINFIDISYLAKFYQHFHEQKWIKFRSQKICMLTYARLQGLQNLIQHFQNSKVLNQKDKKYRPIIRQFHKIQDLVKQQRKHQVQKR